ncbi:MAG: pyridoxal-phosphate dependent enzyme [Cyanobacteria bacterium TGS_CYA1]|nr:pyridoxal-phosphate dependent enzyme [Cyanobacteria bacterium TGS_CYA1]
MKNAIRPTTIIKSVKLNRHLGCDVVLASETFQHTGSFKFRAGYNLAKHVEQDTILTESSGNFGQALAYACQLLGKKCIVVMPSTSAQVKVDAVRNFGGIAELTDVKVKSRRARLEELIKEYPDAYVASAYNDRHVIEGNASLGREICGLAQEINFVLAPVGGGGLTSGIIEGIKQCGKRIKVVGAEPKMANDASRSLQAGHIVANEQEPQTIADGARVLSIGNLNWAILQNGIERIIEVPEENIKTGLKLLFDLANLKCEPTGALSIGALLCEPNFFHGKTVCCVISGGNVDPSIYKELIS